MCVNNKNEKKVQAKKDGFILIAFLERGKVFD